MGGVQRVLTDLSKVPTESVPMHKPGHNEDGRAIETIDSTMHLAGRYLIWEFRNEVEAADAFAYLSDMESQRDRSH